VYLVGGPATTERSAVARLLEEHGTVLETDLPAAELGNERTAIPSRPCHVVVLVPSAPVGDEYAAGAARVGIWLETGALTTEEAAAEILARTDSVREPLVVVDYDPSWPETFERLARPVRDSLADLGAEIEHVGSTAVPGLAAKPIIDIDVVVPSAAEVPAAIERLRGLGYVYQGDKGVPGREALLWPPGSPRHHLYVVVAGSEPHAAHLAFRDRLRADPETAARYAELKRDLAERHHRDRIAYGEGKNDFVAAVLCG
jgi:GrpB-like predicted nucleotidyltransferase (UPF0157 family)